MLHTIKQVDIQRVRDCLQQKVTDRGCGKTVAKVMLMISAALNLCGKVRYTAHFAFIGENAHHVYDIQYMAMQFLGELNFTILHHYNGRIAACYPNGTRVDFSFYSPEKYLFQSSWALLQQSDY